ncbi:hypothetical protein ACOMHN_064697 [Nucella lapillus]
MVQKAVEALLRIRQPSEKESLLNDADAVHLQFGVKKIQLSQKKVQLKLPNGLRKKEACLFVKDMVDDRDYEKSVRHFKQMLKVQGIDCVTEVIPLKALKLEYKPYEAKRKLSNSYDIFLADARIIRLLPSFLGKAFYGRNRLPVQVRMDAKDLKGEFEAAVSNSVCCLRGRGSSSMATVGTTDMSVAELTQNVCASVAQIAAALPGGALNLRTMVLKTNDSMAVPFYVSTDSANDVHLPKAASKKGGEGIAAEEVTTVENALVKVYPSGVVKLFNPSGKIIKGKTVKKPVKALKRAGKRDPKKAKRAAKRVPQKTKKAGKVDLQKTKKVGKVDLQKTKKAGKVDLQKTTKAGKVDLQKTTKAGKVDLQKTTKPGKVDPKQPKKAGKVDSHKVKRAGKLDPKKTKPKSGEVMKKKKVGGRVQVK